MTVEVTKEELSEQLGLGLFCLFWEGKSEYIGSMEIYAPNVAQCWRTVELMRRIAKHLGYSTDGVFVKRPTPANDGWWMIVIKYPKFKRSEIEQLFNCANKLRNDYAKSI